MKDKKYEMQHELVRDLLLPDKAKARCVLEMDLRVLEDYDEFQRCCKMPISLIRWMGNLMTLTGAFLYVKFNQWRTETGAHPTDKERPNALYLKRLLAGVQSTSAYFTQASSGLRVLRVLDGLYDNFDMNFLVIKYLLTNLQIETGFNGKGGLSKLIGFPNEKSLRIMCEPSKFDNEFEKEGQNLVAAFNYVSVCRNDPDLRKTWDSGKYKVNEVLCAFEDVFKTMEFMKRVKLDIDSEGNVNFIETALNGEEKFIPSHGVVRIFEKNEDGKYAVYKSGMDMPRKSNINFFLLERIEYLSDITKINATARLLYQSFDESNSVSAYFSEEDGLELEDCLLIFLEKKSAADYIKRVSGYLPGTRSTTSFFRGMITTLYRYFNILAPSIVDAIDKDTDIKKRVLKKFVIEEEALFKEALEPAFKTLESELSETFPGGWKDKIDKLCNYISNVRSRDNKYNFRTVIDWDALMLRILIYEGPSEILKTVLLRDKADYEERDIEDVENICKTIIAGLEMRYIDNIFEASNVANEQEEYYNRVIKPKLQKLKDYYPEKYVLKVESKALAQSYIDTIIRELTNLDKNKNSAEKLEDKFAENNIQDTLEILAVYNEDKEYSKAYKVFLETIKAFLSFYAGIRKSCSSRMSYEFEKSASILSPDKIDKKHEEIKDAFFNSVRERTSELSKLFNKAPDDTTKAVEDALRELWEFAKMPTEEIKYYKAILGRAPINAKKLAEIFKVSDGKIKKIIFTHNGEEHSFENAKENDIIIECLENVIRFLAGLGMDNKSKAKNLIRGDHIGYKEYVERVVYPQIVTFAKQHEDGDANNCLIMNHSGAFAKLHKGEVQILTEFKYTINHSYYTLPNLNSIETEWWVDPILISCDEFDEAIRNASEDRENMR